MIDLEEGVPGVTAPEPLTFEEFWPYYLSQHLHPLTRAIHATGTIAAVAVGVTALAARRPRVFAAAPLLAYVPAFASHFTVEGNRPATLGGHALWSARSDFRMLRRIVTRNIDSDVRAIRRSLRMRDSQVTLGDWRRDNDEQTGIELRGTNEPALETAQPNA